MNQAVDWHSKIAEDFDAKYRQSTRFIERQNLWNKLIARFISPGSRVLDAGCGSGIFTCEAAKRAGHVRAIDASSEMIALAQQRAAAASFHNISFENTTLENCVLGTGQFDVVLCSSVLEYVTDYKLILTKFAASLADGGMLIVSMPNAFSFHRLAERIVFRATGWPRYFAHVRHVIAPDRLKAELADLGLFEIERFRYGMGWNVEAPGNGLGASQWIAPLFLLIVRKPDGTSHV